MTSRRDFLRSTALSLPLLMLPTGVSNARRAKPSEIRIGLWFGDEDLEGMRRAYGMPLFKSMRDRVAAIDRDAERRFLENGVRYNDQLFDILRLSNNAQLMAMHYLMTGDEDAADLAADSIRAIMQFDRWDYFLEAGHLVVGIQRASSTLIATMAVADWLGDFVATSEVRNWMSIAGKKGCEACYRALFGMRHPDRVVGWTRDESSTYFEHRPDDRVDLSRRHIILNTTNLKAVPAAALAIGAAGFRKTFGSSPTTERWFEQAAYSLSSFRDYYKSDGSYDEGVSYGHYTSLHLVSGFSVLQRSGGPDLTDIINWPGYVDYVTGMSLATRDDPYDIVNFGDNGNPKTGEAGSPARTAVAWYTARKFRDGRARWFAENLGGSQDEWSLCFFDPGTPSDAPKPGLHIWHGKMDWITARSGYAADDWVLAMRSGGPSNHEHADRNSIILKAFGEQLVADPYRPPYQYLDPRWMMRWTNGHSALLIDGQPHQYHDGTEGTNASLARARIVRKVQRDTHVLWTSDATPAYRLVNPDVASVTRTVLILPDAPLFLVMDKVIKSREPSKIQTRYFGLNHDGHCHLSGNGNRFEISRRNVHLFGISAASNGAVTSRVDQLPIPQDEAVKHPFVEVATDTASLNSFVISVLHAGRDMSESAARISTDGNVHTVTIPVNGKTVSVEIQDTGELPECKVYE